jgi:hypothetical protein
MLFACWRITSSSPSSSSPIRKYGSELPHTSIINRRVSRGRNGDDDDTKKLVSMKKTSAVS